MLGERVLTEFDAVEGSSLIEIHKCLRNTCGGDAEGVSSVRHWVRRFKSSEKDIGDWSCIFQLAMAATSGTVKDSCQRNSWKEMPQ